MTCTHIYSAAFDFPWSLRRENFWRDAIIQWTVRDVSSRERTQHVEDSSVFPYSVLAHNVLVSINKFQDQGAGLPVLSFKLCD